MNIEECAKFWRESSHKLQDVLIDIGRKAIDTDNRSLLDLVEKTLNDHSHDFKNFLNRMAKEGVKFD